VGIEFPCIVKPDIGEGGFLVRRINSEIDLLVYHETHSMNYLVQELIDVPMEVSILVHNAKGKLEISSITERKPLTIFGDGRSTLRELIFQD
jgi:glutathione synthase/RimK-type ligase-like ATP-grasp enzyme